MSVAAILDPEVDLPSLPARDRIITTAYRLFYRDGIRATGVDKVIAEAGVTKVTFYRHFAAKDALILTYLEVRHERWMEWFRDAMVRHSNRSRGRNPVVGSIAEWLGSDTFRGCAFINSVGELGTELPAVRDVTARHKAAMIAAIKETLPAGPHRARSAQAIGVAVDGAVVQAQCTRDVSTTVRALRTVVAGVLANTDR